MALSQIPMHNSQPSSPHYESAGKTAVPPPDPCGALLSTHFSLAKPLSRKERSQSRRLKLWIVPRFRSVAQMASRFLSPRRWTVLGGLRGRRVNFRLAVGLLRVIAAPCAGVTVMWTLGQVGLVLIE